MSNKQKSPKSDILASLFEMFLLFGVLAGLFVSGVFQLETWQYILLSIGCCIWFIFNVATLVRSAKRLKYQNQRSFNINPNPQEHEEND